MQTFQEVRKNFYLLGFSSDLERFNHKTLSIVVFLFLCVTSQWTFLLCEAKDAHEYMESIYIIATCTAVLLSISSTVLIRKEFFSFIENVDNLINDCKLNTKLPNDYIQRLMN